MFKMKKFFKIAVPVFLIAVIAVAVAAVLTDGFKNPEAKTSHSYSEKKPTSGKCGDNLKWAFDSETNVLEIKGKGAMYDYQGPYDHYNDQTYDDILRLNTLVEETENCAPWYSYHAEIDEIVLGDGITHIGSNAFYSVWGLVNIAIPDSVTSIGNEAFNGCSALMSISIPDSVTKIGSYAFSGCYNIKSITVPQSVTILETGAFGGTELINFRVDENNPNFSNDENGVLFNKDKTELLQYPGGRDIAFYVIPESVISISEAAFSNCSYLEKIMLRSNVKNIASSALDCNEFRVIYVEENNPYFSSDENGILFNKDKTELIQFPCSSSIESYSIPDGVTSINDRAFASANFLESVTIPDSVTSIGEEAFSDSGLTHIEIPDGVTDIKAYTFNSNNVLTSISFGNGVKTIGERAFSDCSSLEKLTIPDTVTSIGDGAFRYCDVLTDVTIGNAVKTIGKKAFESCECLLSVTMGDSVTSIGSCAFDSCYNLESVTFGKNVKTIGDNAFNLCFCLKDAVIPDSVTSIGNNAFRGCNVLTDVTIGKGVKTIGEKAFDDNLKDIHYVGSREEWDKISVHESNDFTSVIIHYNSTQSE